MRCKGSTFFETVENLFMFRTSLWDVVMVVVSFLPSDNPYGIATISVGNDVRLNYEFDVFWHPVGMHHYIISDPAR